MVPGLRVLFVDDDHELLASVGRALSLEPHRVFLLSDANEAISLVEKENIDVVVCDNSMPSSGTSGVRLLQDLAARYPHVVRILMTGSGDLDAHPTVLSGVRLLQKPWGPGELEELLKLLAMRGDGPAS